MHTAEFLIPEQPTGRSRYNFIVGQKMESTLKVPERNEFVLYQFIKRIIYEQWWWAIHEGYLSDFKLLLCGYGPILPFEQHQKLAYAQQQYYCFGKGYRCYDLWVSQTLFVKLMSRALPSLINLINEFESAFFLCRICRNAVTIWPEMWWWTVSTSWRPCSTILEYFVWIAGYW